MTGVWFKWMLIVLHILHFAIAQYPAAVPPPGYGANNPVNVVPSGYGVPAPVQPSGSGTLSPPAPVVTQAPTPAPIITQTPTVAPIVTQASTAVPVVTQAPTPAPIITQAPTVAPIVTQAPTTIPVVTQAPTVPVLNTTVVAATEKLVVTPGQVIEQTVQTVTKSPETTKALEIVTTEPVTVKALTEPVAAAVSDESPPDFLLTTVAAEIEIPIPTIAEAQPNEQPSPANVQTLKPGNPSPVATEPPVPTEAPGTYPPPVIEVPGTQPPAGTEPPVITNSPGVQPTTAITAAWSKNEIPQGQVETLGTEQVREWTQVSSGPQTSPAQLEAYLSPKPALTRLKPEPEIDEKPKTRLGIQETIPFSTPAPPVSGPTNVQPAAAGYGAPPPAPVPVVTELPVPVVSAVAPVVSSAAPVASSAAPVASSAGPVGTSAVPIAPTVLLTSEAPVPSDSPSKPKTDGGYNKPKPTVEQVATTESERAAVLSGTTEKPSIDIPAVNTECDVKNPVTCNRNLLEVCAFRNGTYRCECPPNHSRLQDGRCLVANECFEKKFNDCSDDANCTDTLESYVCTCKTGFTDLSPEKLKPGRVCKKLINECLDPKTYEVNCDENAKCQDTPESYTCSCNSGFFDVSERFSLPPGRKCDKGGDPCSSTDKNDCSKNATCTSNKGVYTCQCKNGYSDVSPNKHYPGRDCRRTDTESPPPSAKCDPKKENTCPAGEKCMDSNSDYMCQCARGTIRSGDNKCVVADSCSGKIDCDANANCISKPGSYDCECKAGYTDVSTNATNRGRKCILPESDCSNRDKNKCSVFANCHPHLSGYQCQCQSGYLDVSSYNGKPNGHVCIKEKNECSDPHMNACDENADCVKKPDGYACLCQKGFYDVSTSANLAPGRVCSLQTNCPAQPTDLIFLIDGSGSIGSATFKTEILRFISEFVGLFTIAPDQTRVGVIQYSDIIRKEFDLNQYPSAPALQKGINSIQYLAGLTHTGEAVEYMQKEGFSESHGARSDTKNVHRIAIVITDGRAQDNVAKPSKLIRDAGVVMFAVGVTDHIQESQLLEIAGNYSRVFIVGTYKDLNTKLRAAIQKELCPPGPPPTNLNKCPECDPSRNYICKDGNCVCPEGFCEDPVNKVCGAQLCNPDISFVTCPYPMVCKETPFKNHRCACPSDFSCDLNDGRCINQTLLNQPCPEGQERNPATRLCEGCKPQCDANKNQYCLSDPKGGLFCGCKDRGIIDPVTQVCAQDECKDPALNTCHQYANCTDTLESYFCTCLTGYEDRSPNPKEPGRLCVKIENPCANKKNNCSSDGECIPDTLGHFSCRCKEGYVDKYPPLPGRDCEKRVNECIDPNLNNCSKNADCHDLQVGYSCICKAGYQDLKPYEDPGRFCVIDPCQDESKNDCWLKRCRVVDINTGQFTCEPCPPGYDDADLTRPGRNCQTKVEPCADRKRNTCDPNAFCIGIPGKPEEYTCKCRDGYLDESKDPKKPGRECNIIKNPCFDVTKNDCDTNAHCQDLHNNKYNCTCKEGFHDKSLDSSKPGRICKLLIDECRVSQLNNCSAYAHCKNLEEGYNCTCFDGYKDKSENGLFGRVCIFIPDPCSSASLNECDIHAKCTRVGEDKYKCECLPPYKENSTNPEFPGRHCIYDGCSVKVINTCGINAECINGDGYINCKCKDGYIDQDELRPGAKCIPEPKCGGIKCNKTLGLQCNTTSDRCMCKPGWSQKNEFSKCVECTPINLYLWVVRRNQNIYTYTPEFSNLDNPKTKEIIKMFVDGVGKTYDTTPLANCYINSQVREIQNPSNRNPNWNNGLWVEFTGCFDKTCAPDDYAAWRTLVDTIKRSFNYSVGGTELYINEYQLPFACYKNTCDKNANCTEVTPTSYTCVCFANYVDSDPDNPGRSCIATTTQKTTTVPPCGTQICKPYAGETCIKQRCVCVKGKARRDPNDECEDYCNLIYIPIIVIRKGASVISCSADYNNPDSKAYKDLVPNYVKNIDESFKNTEIYNTIVAEGVTDVTNPAIKFTDYTDGCLINTSVAVRKCGNDKEVCEQLKEAIRNNNNFIGMSPLKIDEEFDMCNPSARKKTTTTPIPTTTPHGPFCGGAFCKEGQFCIDGKCSDCKKDEELDSETHKCIKIIECGGKRCRKGQFCVDGKCSDCKAGQVKHPETNECTDKTNVGPPCGNAYCKLGEFCVDGKCSPCDIGQQMNPATKKCQDLCGGILCKDGEFCVQGNTCSECPEGQAKNPATRICEGVIDCNGNKCTKDQFCIHGECSNCPEGFTMNADTKKCEKLGVECGGGHCKEGQFCVDGKCQACPKGKEMNPDSKKCEEVGEKCGGVNCKPEEYCVDDKCSSCPKGKEMNPESKSCEEVGEKCGNIHCKPEEFCVDGKCSACPKGKMMNPDTNKCEPEGPKCGDGHCKPEEYCVDGKCSICPKAMVMNPDTNKCEPEGPKCGDGHCKPEEFCVDGKCSACPKGKMMNPDTNKCEPEGEQCGDGHCKQGQHCVNGKCQECAEGMVKNPETNKCEPKLIECNGVTCKKNQSCVNGRCQDCPEGQWMNPATNKCEDAITCNLKLWILRKNEERLKLGSLNRKEATDSVIVGVPTAYDKVGLGDTVLDVDVREFSKAPDGEQGVIADFTVYFKKDGAPPTDEECLDKLITSVIENFNYSIGGTPYYMNDKVPPCTYIPNRPCKPCPPGITDQSPMTPGKNCRKNTICNGVTCKIGQFCNKDRCNPCPEDQWQSGAKCEDAAACDLTLWIVRKNEEKINYNSSYADPDSAHRQDLVKALKTGCPIAYAKVGINKEDILGVDVREMSKPPDNKNGIITEFTVYFKKANAPPGGECLDKLVTSIVENFNYSVGGTPYYINDIPPCTLTPKTPCKACPEGTTDQSPMTPGKNCIKDPCSKHNCDINAVCVPLAKGGFTCKCKKGFKDNSTKPDQAGRTCFYDFCLDFPDCQASNGTCVNYKEYANCECNKTYTDLRKYPPSIKRVCHGDSFCLLNVDVDYCCLQIHNCHPTATCLTLPTGGYQCKCKDIGTTVADNIACPAATLPTNGPGLLVREPRCAQCNNNGDCVLSESGLKTTCQCSTWYTGETCATDIRIVLAIIFAILFLLLTLCCLIYYCLKCRCFGGGASYREMSSSEASQRESITGGKESSLYQDFAIPRPKIKDAVAGAEMQGSRETVDESRSREQRSLERYLDSGDRAPSVERVAGNTVAISDVIHHLPAGASMMAREDSYYSDSGSEVSSSQSMQEQYERRVITDYKKSETTRTSAAANTTAEFHVFPPNKVPAIPAITTGASATYKESTRSSHYDDDEESTRAGSTITSSTEVTAADPYDKKTLVKRRGGK